MATSFGLMQTTPKHLVTCIAPKRSMMLAPAPRKTNKKCKQIAEIINKQKIFGVCYTFSQSDYNFDPQSI